MCCWEITEAPELDSFYGCTEQRNTAKPLLPPGVRHRTAVGFSNALLRKRLPLAGVHYRRCFSDCGAAA